VYKLIKKILGRDLSTSDFIVFRIVPVLLFVFFTIDYIEAFLQWKFYGRTFYFYSTTLGLVVILFIIYKAGKVYNKIKKSFEQ
jgi:hypothetical protein